MTYSEYVKTAFLNELSDRICRLAGINPLAEVDPDTEECDETDAINSLIDDFLEGFTPNV